MGQKNAQGYAFARKFRTQLIVLVLLPAIPALVLALQRDFQQRRLEKDRIVQSISAVSRLIAANELAYIKNARQLLTTLAPLSFLVHATNRPFCDVHFQNLVKLSPDFLNFGLIESNGTVFSAAVVPHGIVPSLADRSYFRRAIETRGFAIGEHQVGRLTEQKGLNFGYPVMDAVGNVQRVIFASLRSERLTEAARQVPLPPSSVVTILDRTGTILSRFPDEGEWVGKTVPDMSLVQNVLRVQEGTVTSLGLDGVKRAYALSSIHDDTAAAIFVAVGVPTEVLFANANRVLIRNLIVLTGSILVALCIASIFAERVFLRPVQDLAAAAHRLAGGDLQARAEAIRSTAELGNLSETFNTMASRLQARDADLSAAHASIQNLNSSLEKKVTERTAELTAANQELEAFSYSVSHDLRAPLRHLDGFAELLRRNQKERLDEKGQRHLDVISQAARKMGILIDELLVFSRMGRQELMKNEAGTLSIVREVIAQLEPDYAERKIEWNLSDLRPVEADPAMLKQVWINLISNAIKYTRPRAVARIEIGSSDTETETIFHVRDNGVGFDMRFADKLFGVFQRLHGDNEFEGTGIGLANVRRIILRHGGRTWAEAVPGEGATFYFSLPQK